MTEFLPLYLNVRTVVGYDHGIRSFTKIFSYFARAFSTKGYPEVSSCSFNI
ncbi:MULTISPECIES: hypothetical protein [unclassified Rickettsia]|uniref:hypothetical protein n=1 Tax=unclassified Rickettsia TaxID=114295 RepID=UPI003132C810